MIDLTTLNKKLENCLQDINQNLDLVNLSIFGQNIVPDSDMNIFLFCNHQCIATSGISFGLDEYYFSNLDCHPEIKKNPYKKAITYAKDKWIITQMQGAKNCDYPRKDIKYKRILMNCWNTINMDLKLNLNLYLPAKLNYWVLPSREFKYTAYKPNMECLLMNYDYNAKRHKFQLNKHNLYERKIN